MSSNNQKVPMTPKGLSGLKKELENLIKVERPKNVQAIEVARGHGDLSENADYSAAKEHQAWITSRIAEIEDKIARAEVIDVKKISSTHITFGATVRLCNLNTDEEVEYKIVGADEADIKNNTISIDSPVARALIGKEEGDDVSVRTPGGLREYGILEVKFIE